MPPVSVEVGEGENPVELGATSNPKSSSARARRSEIQAGRATRLSWQKGENQASPLPPYIPAHLRQPPVHPPIQTVNRFKFLSLDLKKQQDALPWLPPGLLLHGSAS